MTDGVLLADAVERLHPDPFGAVTRERFVAESRRAETPTGLMRLLTLLGDRNGHTAIHPLDEHVRPLHAFPIVPYEFEDGVFVVAAQAPELVGSELVAVAGLPVEELNAALAPLVAHDNEWTIRARRPVFGVCVEVLLGLAILDEPRLTVRLRGREARLDPVTAAEYRQRLGRGDRLPPGRGDRRIEPIDGGRALHVAYDVTRGDTTQFAAAIETAAVRADRIVLDLRHNSGGNNQTYGPLLEGLERLTARGKRLAVLSSRVTFSAAMQLVVDLEQRTPAVFVGEPTGGSPNQYGDAVAVELPETGLTARVATVSWTTAGMDDGRVTREPDISVPLTAAAYFAGDDPVLRAALSV
jgi:hypothetical protein